MENVITRPNGNIVPIDSVAQSFTYATLPDGTKKIATATVVYSNITYIQTFTYSGNLLADVSAWIQQP